MAKSVVTRQAQGWGVLIHGGTMGPFLASGPNDAPAHTFFGTYAEARRFRKELRAHINGRMELVRLTVTVSPTEPALMEGK